MTQTPAQIAQKATQAYDSALAQGLADNDPEAYRKAVIAYLRVLEG